MDIFKSVPEKDAVIIDATGPNDLIILDMQNGLGERFHFEHKNKDCPFVPPSSNLIKPPSGAGKASTAELRKHIIIFKVGK